MDDETDDGTGDGIDDEADGEVDDGMDDETDDETGDETDDEAEGEVEDGMDETDDDTDDDADDVIVDEIDDETVDVLDDGLDDVTDESEFRRCRIGGRKDFRRIGLRGFLPPGCSRWPPASRFWWFWLRSRSDSHWCLSAGRPVGWLSEEGPPGTGPPTLGRRYCRSRSMWMCVFVFCVRGFVSPFLWPFSVVIVVCVLVLPGAWSSQGDVGYAAGSCTEVRGVLPLSSFLSSSASSSGLLLDFFLLAQQSSNVDEMLSGGDWVAVLLGMESRGVTGGHCGRNSRSFLDENCGCFFTHKKGSSTCAVSCCVVR